MSANGGKTDPKVRFFGDVRRPDIDFWHEIVKGEDLREAVAVFGTANALLFGTYAS